jgi:small-conductance mechanosensitive channel
VIQKIAAGFLALLLVAAGIAWWRTAPPSPKVIERRAAAVTSAALVDESTYTTAQRMARLAATPEELTFVQTALRIADHELALAFTAALRDVEAHPVALSPEALKIQDRLQRSQLLLDADQQRVAQLTAAVAQAKPSQRDALQDELELATSQLDLDKDEVEEADQDLVAAGGNPQQRIEVMVQEHDAQAKARATSTPALSAASSAAPHGSLMQFRDWLRIRQKLQALSAAQFAAEQKADALGKQRIALASSLEDSKGGISELAQHTKTAKAAGTAGGTAPAAGGAAPPPHSHEDAAALLRQTKLITANQKILTLLDRQTADQRQLAGVYRQWIGAVSLQSSALAHKLLLDAAIVAGILLALLFLDKWAQRLLDNPKLDRRQVETLRSITRISLRVIAVFVIILILVGMPSQFGTMIGIVGAGLTVALKDFIVAFFGWLVLMGRNGIRLGDWVEINGVSGEVTELGMFHTVLLETGNWSDAGHPTGRRVTFTNSFAIEGHYFNFSTSGQWLWDQLQVVVPAGQDPYPIVDAITKLVVEATAESARQAEQEWQRAVPAQRSKTFSGTPGVNVKPVIGGVEISVRYITRANERFQLRAKLYQAAVDLLGQKAVLRTASAEPAIAPADR